MENIFVLKNEKQELHMFIGDYGGFFTGINKSQPDKLYINYPLYYTITYYHAELIKKYKEGGLNIN